LKKIKLLVYQLIFKKSKFISFSIIVFIFTTFYFFGSEKTFIENNSYSQSTSEFQNSNVFDEIEPFCLGIDQSDEVKSPNQINSLDIEIQNSRDWYTNFLSAYLEEGPIILDKYKKTFISNISVNTDSHTCTFLAEVRISGDFKDHLYGENFNPSLDVKLLEGNILNITRFKLFLPSSKNADDEVFFANLMKELGFLSPKTFYTNVNINKKSSHKYIFQEKINKEFLESNGLRESAIFESNEKIYWEVKKKNLSSSREVYKSLIFGKVLNSNWAVRSDVNLSTTLAALETFNAALLTSRNWWNLNNSLLSKNSFDLYKFDAAMIAAGAEHGLVLHNRKFYYNFYDNNFYPIYYDGMPDFSKDLSNKDLTNKINLNINFDEYDLEKIKTYIDLNTLIKASNLLKSQIEIEPDKFVKILEKNNLFLDLNYVENTLNKFINNITYISNLTISNKNKKFIENFENLDEDILRNSINNLREIYNDVPVNFVTINQNDFNVKSCEFDLSSCQNLQNSKDVIKDLLDDEFSENRNIVYGSNINKFLNTSMENSRKLPVVIQNAEIYLKGSSYIEFDELNNVLNVYIGDRGNVLITSKNNPILFNVKLVKKPEDSSDEFFQDIFTGCLNFYEVKFLNNLIYSENQNCEDSVNIINSKGTIKKIEILNSFSDGLDVDFSNLIIESVYINNSGNDCADFSYGIYTVKDMVVSKCNDKGISIGELSTFDLSKLTINNVFNGLAVKDSSKLIVGDLMIEDVDYCITTYRKKQEFSGGEVKYNQVNCQENRFFVQKGSTVYKND